MIAEAYMFDAYGTLFDVHSAVRRHADSIGPASVMLSEMWRRKQLEYSWMRALTGRYRDFAALTEEALDFAFASVAPEHTRLKQVLLDAYRTLDAYPEVRGVLAQLKVKGARTAILSNGTPDMLAAAVSNAGIGDLVDDVLSVDTLRTYKTDPRVYAYAADHVGLAPAAISFQSSNRWDIAGAVAAGYRAVWINRSGQPAEYADLSPTAAIATLADLPGLA